MNTRSRAEAEKIGTIGKQITKQYFKEQGYRISIPRDSNGYIDFFIENEHGIKSVFVRTDTRICKTGNIVIERFLHRYGQNTIEFGWLFVGKADILCYLDANTGVLFIFDWAAMKTFAVNHFKAIPFRNIYDDKTIGDAYLIPARKAERSDAFLGKARLDPSPLLQCSFEKVNPF